MADTLGLLTLPAPAPVGTAAVGDPALSTLGAFLQAALNRLLAPAWATVCPGRDPVEFVYCHDPQTLFDEERLPALYMWRRSWDPEQADDGRIKRTSLIAIWWITEPGSSELLAKRDPIMNAADAAIALALRRGRDPSWIVAGDTDPMAATMGSLLVAQAGFDEVHSGPSTPLGRTLSFQDSDGREVSIPGLITTITVVESLELDTTFGLYPAAVDQDIYQRQDEDDEDPRLAEEYQDPVDE
jgi:hypothetical protein